MTESTTAEPSYPTMTMANFLETHPPGSPVEITDFVHDYHGGQRYTPSQPDLQLYCNSDSCEGVRIFAATSASALDAKEFTNFFLDYRCRNCSKGKKSFALVGIDIEGGKGVVYKIGELPPFGPPVPSRVISLVGPDRELFIKGRRAESQGLGIGAFAYYRRVLENQWHRLLGEIIRVGERLGTDDAILEVLRQANQETQFRSAVEAIKVAIPEALKINGHNPLTLLHKALSEGLHEESEEQCLALAQSIRLILTELADRTGQALKDEAELREAIGRLLNRHAPRNEQEAS